VHSGREERSGFSSLLCGDGQGAPFDEHTRVVDGLKQKSNTPGIVAFPFYPPGPALKRALLDLDVIARCKRRRFEPHIPILRAPRANAGDNLLINRNGCPASPLTKRLFGAASTKGGMGEAVRKEIYLPRLQDPSQIGMRAGGRDRPRPRIH
jgi:hypothetical protein